MRQFAIFRERASNFLLLTYYVLHVIWSRLHVMPHPFTHVDSKRQHGSVYRPRTSDCLHYCVNSYIGENNLSADQIKPRCQIKNSCVKLISQHK